MSFTPITFTYTPPPTVVAPPPTTTVIVNSDGTVTSSNVVSTSAVPTTNAATLSQQMLDLKATSQYIQSVILSLTANTGVSINVAANPAFDRGFKSINGTNSATPTIIPIKIYNNWLDANVGVAQLESAAGVDSPVDVNLSEAADLSTLTNTVENSLLENATYQSQVPLLLRTLKTDAVVFQAWSDALSQYPCNTNPDSTDVSPALNTLLSDTASRYQTAYSAINTLLTTVNAVEADVQNVLNAFLGQSVADITRIMSIFSATKGLMYKSSFTDISKSIANYSVARLAGELGSMVCLADRLTQAVVSPLSNITGPLAAVLSGAQGIASIVGTLPSGAMAGMSTVSTCSATASQASATVLNTPNSVTSVAQSASAYIGQTSAGVQALGEQLNFSLNGLTSLTNARIREFQRTIDSRLSIHGNLTQALCAVRSADALIAIATSAISQMTTSQVPTVTLASGVTVQSTSGTFVSTPPTFPSMPTAVANILT